MQAGRMQGRWPRACDAPANPRRPGFAPTVAGTARTTGPLALSRDSIATRPALGRPHMSRSKTTATPISITTLSTKIRVRVRLVIGNQPPIPITLSPGASRAARNCAIASCSEPQGRSHLFGPRRCAGPSATASAPSRPRTCPYSRTSRCARRCRRGARQARDRERLTPSAIAAASSRSDPSRRSRRMPEP
jgi:hypothetical protein